MLINAIVLEKVVGGRVGSFKILEEIDRGGFATIYEGLDTRNGERVVLKLTQDKKAYNSEIRVLSEMQMRSYERKQNQFFEFNRILEHGQVLVQDELFQTSSTKKNQAWYYIVMPKFGCNLDDFKG